MVAGRGFAARSNVSVAPSEGRRGVSRGGWGLSALTLCLGLACPGCSPTSVALQMRKAEQALAAADDTLAKNHARYELILARLYLEKAREEAGQAHYAWVEQLLASSEHHAVLARALTASRTQDGAGSPTRAPARSSP